MLNQGVVEFNNLKTDPRLHYDIKISLTQTNEVNWNKHLHGISSLIFSQN